ncbi:TatD family hydrolase [bacterium]|nr:TatD family hydrolase [bacterium]
MLVDSHCHLSFKDYPLAERDAVISRAREAGVKTLITIGAGEAVAGNEEALAIAKTDPHIYSTVGIHPHDASVVTPEIIAHLENLALHPKVVAIGEIGLDYHYEHSPRDIQRQVLANFIKLAQKIKKPIMIHDRDAGDETYEMLKTHGVKPGEVMIHCFTGSMELAKKYLDLGTYLSFTGIVTFKKSDELREVVKITPLNQMLIETDSPYLAPVPFRGKTNEPAYVKYVAQKVAEIKGLSFDEIARETTQNAHRFFGILG